MKIIIPLSELEMSILFHLYSLTCKAEFLTPITEKQLRKRIERKASLYKTFKRLIKKGYVMRTYKDGKYYYALSPEGEKAYELLLLLNDPLEIQKINIFTSKMSILKCVFCNNNTEFIFSLNIINTLT